MGEYKTKFEFLVKLAVNRLDKFSIFLTSLFCVKFSLNKSEFSEGLIDYGEIQSEWHEGSPDWAFGPPSK